MAINLPTEYQRVDYIQSDGASYIDTGFYFGSTDDVDLRCKFRYVGQQDSKSIFGCQDNPTISPLLWLNYAKELSLYLGQSFGFITISYSFDTDYDVVITTSGNTYNFMFGSFTSNGTFTQGWTTTQSFLIFGNNFSGNPRQFAVARMYYFKLSINGTLVRHLIPCYRKSDNVIGMYDLVNNVFYTNAGTGTFTKGKNVYGDRIIKIYQGTTPIKKMYLGSTAISEIYKKTPSLPPQYKKAKWVSTSASRRKIHEFTSLPLSPNGKVVFSIQNATEQGLTFNPFTKTISIWFISGSRIVIGGGTNGGADFRTTNKATFEVSSNGLYKDGVKIANLSSSTTTDTNNVFKIMILNTYQLFELKVYDNDVLQHQVIPVMRISDSQYGLFDLITKQFVYDANDIGEL